LKPGKIQEASSSAEVVGYTMSLYEKPKRKFQTKPKEQKTMKRIGAVLVVTLNLLGLSMVTSKIAFSQPAVPGQIAYQSTLNMTGVCTGTLCTFTFPTVPAGHRVVIEHIAGLVSYSSSSPSTTYSILIASTANIAATPLTIAPTDAFTTFTFSTPADTTTGAQFDQSVKLYVAAGKSLNVYVQPPGGLTFSASGVDYQILTLTGYDITCDTTTPCTPIAH
jgi:hypothetical protein